MKHSASIAKNDNSVLSTRYSEGHSTVVEVRYNITKGNWGVTFGDAVLRFSYRFDAEKMVEEAFCVKP